MIIFIDGFQMSGKTTLAENSQFPSAHFGFTDNIRKLEISKELIPGYQLGKDLGMVFLSDHVSKNLIIDRGPLSTVLYSLKENRYGEGTERKMAEFLREISKHKNCKFIWVEGVNQRKDASRDRKDGFDYLDDTHDHSKESLFGKLSELCGRAGIEITVFKNDFSSSLMENCCRFRKLVNEMVAQR